MGKVGADRIADTINKEGPKVQSLSKENGVSRIKVLFVLLILFSVVHVGVKLSLMYIDAEGMKDEMVTKARFAQAFSDARIVYDLAKKAKGLDLPLGPESFKLLRNEDTKRMRISTAWDVELHFFFDVYPPYTVKTFHFAPVIEEDYSRKF
jgi:hypothetical protein